MWAARLTLLLCASPAAAAQPLQAPPRFVSPQYGLTFRTVAGMSYCPLLRGRTGSDHGTVIFLQRPRRCGGAGFPSTSRAFLPRDAARIELYYRYWMGDDEPSSCRQVATLRFLGRPRPVCRRDENGLIVEEVRARYMADVEAEAVLTLATTPSRLRRDREAFRRLAESSRACTSAWSNPTGKKKSFTIGTGAPCPVDGAYF
jgi:hypothetical protein